MDKSQAGPGDYASGVGIRLWPVIISELVGGPDDGDVRRLFAGRGPKPPEAMAPSASSTGHYVRHPEPAGRWMWHFLWVEDPGDRER